jgi:hypothetical protein
MTLSEFRRYLLSAPTHTLRFILPDGDEIPVHAHITEVGRIDKKFIDCGGTMRSSSVCSLQAWVAENDETHRLAPGKLARVLDLAEPILEGDDLEVEIEYEECSISQYPLASCERGTHTLTFRLGSKHTDCLAKELCTTPQLGAAKAGCC